MTTREFYAFLIGILLSALLVAVFYLGMSVEKLGLL